MYYIYAYLYINLNLVLLKTISCSQKSTQRNLCNKQCKQLYHTNDYRSNRLLFNRRKTYIFTTEGFLEEEDLNPRPMSYQNMSSTRTRIRICMCIYINIYVTKKI